MVQRRLFWGFGQLTPIDRNNSYLLVKVALLFGCALLAESWMFESDWMLIRIFISSDCLWVCTLNLSVRSLPHNCSFEYHSSFINDQPWKKYYCLQNFLYTWVLFCLLTPTWPSVIFIHMGTGHCQILRHILILEEWNTGELKGLLSFRWIWRGEESKYLDQTIKSETTDCGSEQENKCVWK